MSLAQTLRLWHGELYILDSDLQGMREGHDVALAMGLTAPVGHTATLAHLCRNEGGYKLWSVLCQVALPVAKI